MGSRVYPESPPLEAVSPRWSASVPLPARVGAGQWQRVHTRVLLAIVLIGSLTRVLYVDRPFDHRLLAPWREADYTQLARNFYRDGLDILHPKIDWRGDTPGYAEMELPVIPWLGAALYRVFGYHEALLRVPAALFGVLSMFVFAALCRRSLPPTGALFAAAAFALNPLLIVLGNAMQPDPLMLVLSLVAVALIWRWQEDPTFAGLLAAAAATGAAILAKSPAACVGIVLAYSVMRTLGRRAFTDVRVYAAALIALLPPLAWYLWAWRFWHLYGNSLGVSNESHFIGLDMLVPPHFLYGLLKWETLGVFTPAGWVLAAAALRVPRRAERALVWYAAVCLFYVVTARTTADDWSFYYHGISVAPGCLLMGAGLAAFGECAAIPRGRGWLAAHQRWIGRLLAAGALAGLVVVTGALIHRRDARGDYLTMWRCALEFVPYVPADERIVAYGGNLVDELGHPVAHNESMLFGWMDRKGFNYAEEELSIATLDRIAARGGRYWVVGRAELERSHLSDVADAHYRRVAACENRYDLYDLRGSVGSSE